jgi:hypothetical protein
MDPIPLLEFDIRGNNPKNTIPGEKWNLKDKTLNWYLPNGSPFFGEPGLVVVYDEAGRILRRDRDYYVEGEFVPFCAITGRSICSYIRLSDAVVKNNSFVKVDYQSLGAYFVPRNSLQEWIDAMNAGKVPIPWSKVFGVPPTLPPEYHLHNAKTEIMDWYDFAQFFQVLEGFRQARDPDFNKNLTAVVEKAYAALAKARDEQLQVLVAHDRNYYNPHGIEDFDLDLGNVDNFRTATPAEDMAGVINNAFSTPYGVTELAKTFVPDTDKTMLSGIFPISSFGGESFIPPSISGSFEGMGQVNECSGICLEPGGLVMLLTNHLDGRTKGLYFSIVTDYDKPETKIQYTNYKYVPPSLSAQGIDVDTILAGSGNKVIMVGQRSTNNWYLALTNGTFDPGSHAFVKCDMTAVVNVFGSPWVQNDLASVHLMGEYIVLIQSYLSYEGLGNVSRQQFFRCKTSDVRDGKPIVWEKIRLTYQNWHGENFSNAEFMQVAKATVNAAGNRVTKVGPWTPNLPLYNFAQIRRVLHISLEKPNSNGIHYLRQFQYWHLAYRELPEANTVATTMEMQYEFNPATGVFSLTMKSPPIDVDVRSGFLNNAGRVRYTELDPLMVSYTCPATVLLSSGHLLCSSVVEAGILFPTQLVVVKMKGLDNPASVMERSWANNVVSYDRVERVVPKIKPATLNGTSPATLAYDPEGELFEALDQDSGIRQAYYRRVSGGYAVRDGVSNLTLGALYSRPLVTSIYKANLRHEDGYINITGTDAELAAAGVEQGSLSLSVGGYSSTYPNEFLPVNAAMRAPASANVKISWPRTHKRTIDELAKTATFTPDSFYGMRQALIDKLYSFVPTEGRTNTWSFTVYMLGAESGYMFRNLNLMLITVNWTNDVTGRFGGEMILARPVVEAPNADHPGVYLVQDYTFLHAISQYNASVNRSKQDGFGQQLYHGNLTKTFLSIYRDGNSLKIYGIGGYTVTTSDEGNNPMRFIVDLNLANNQLSNLFTGGRWGGWGEMAAMIPRWGLSDSVTLANGLITEVGPDPFLYTGGGASIFKKSGLQFMLGSVYPETGWLLFIQDGIRVIINGAAYTVPGGTIDIRDVDPAPQNKTFYLYVTIEDDEPRYVLSSIALRKSGSMIRVSTIVTNEKQILTITREQPFMVGDLLLSYTREGGTIPMSTGFPQDEGQFVFVRQGELLP